jgi:hypothetical protein
VGRLAFGLTVLLLPFLAGCAPSPIAECAQGGDAVCGFEKPEDLVLLPGTRSALVIEHGGKTQAAGFSVLDLAQGRRMPLSWTTAREDTVGAAQCAAPPEKFAPGGIDLVATEKGWRVLAVNRASPARIEFFDVTDNEGDLTLTWKGCVAVAEGLFLNDVAAAPDGSLYATHMVEPQAARTAMAPLRFFFGLDTGYVVRWSRAEGWNKVPKSDGSFPNGIALSADGNTLYFAETFGERVNRIDLATGMRKACRLAFQPDNLTWSDDGALIAVGHDGLPLLTTRGCRNLADQGCGFSFRVARIDASLRTVSMIYRSDGRVIPGASTALVDGGNLWLGTAFGDRVTRVSLSAPSSRTPPASH